MKPMISYLIPNGSFKAILRRFKTLSIKSGYKIYLITK